MARRHAWRPLPGLLALGALGTLLAACKPPAAATLPAAGPLPVGAVLSLTGNASLYGQDQRIGLDLARAAHPGRGRPLALTIEDGGSDEAGATGAFQLLIRRGSLALIGPTLSQQAFAADPIAERQGVPVLAPSNTATGIPQLGAFISRVSAQSSVIAPLSIDRALRLNPGLKRAVVFYAQDDAYSTAETTIFQKALAERGLGPLSVQRTQLNDQDFLNQITAALQLKPDLVVLSLQAVDGGNLVRQLRELGYTGTIVVGNGMNTPNIYPLCRRACNGLLIAQAYSPELDTPVNRAFVARYQAARGSTLPPQLTAQAFTAYQVVAEALERLQSRGPLGGRPLAEVRRELNTELLAGRYDTPLGPIRFTPEGEVIQERFYMAQVKMAADGRTGRFALLP
jgi:branched-chain amino acid transport system substrate-binding protein